MSETILLWIYQTFTDNIFNVIVIPAIAVFTVQIIYRIIKGY